MGSQRLTDMAAAISADSPESLATRVSLLDQRFVETEKQTNKRLDDIDDRISEGTRQTEAGFKELGSKFDNFRAERNQIDIDRAKPPYALWIAVAGVAVTIFGILTGLVVTGFSAFWIVMSMRIEGSIHPLSEKVTTNETRLESYMPKIDTLIHEVSTLDTKAADSARNRSEHDESIRRLNNGLNDTIKELSEERATRRANEGEIATQFFWSGQSINTQFAEQQRRDYRQDWALYDMGAKYPKPPEAPVFFPSYEPSAAKGAGAGTGAVQ